MLWNDDILFIHVPKTGGMSVTSFLEATLPPPIFISVPAGHEDSTSSAVFVEGTRHERLHEAQATLARNGRELRDFKVIIAGMRNPYEMEVSRYHHIRKHFFGQPLKNVQIIKEGGFESFARDSNFYGKNPPDIEEFYTLKGELPPELRILRSEFLEEDLRDVLGDSVRPDARIPHINSTEHPGWREMLTPYAEEAIYRRFQWLFDQGFYERFAMET